MCYINVIYNAFFIQAIICICIVSVNICIICSIEIRTKYCIYFSVYNNLSIFNIYIKVELKYKPYKNEKNAFNI